MTISHRSRGVWRLVSAATLIVFFVWYFARGNRMRRDVMRTWEAAHEESMPDTFAVTIPSTTVATDREAAPVDDPQSYLGRGQPRPLNNTIFSPELSTASIVNVKKAANRLSLDSTDKAVRIISMALYGDDYEYIHGALTNALLTRRDWPGWRLRIYHDSSVPAKYLSQLEILGTELVDVNAKHGGNFGLKDRSSSKQKAFQAGKDHSGMFWRFYVILDPSVTRFIIRDTDSQVSRRDRAAVNEWIEQGHYFHSMRDHPGHSIPILGGMWGSVGGLISTEVILSFRERTDPVLFNDDQRFLEATLWPDVMQYTLCHDAYHCENTALRGNMTMPFPVQREWPQDFVGNCYRDGVERATAGECPAACRRQNDWTSC